MGIWGVQEHVKLYIGSGFRVQDLGFKVFKI